MVITIVMAPHENNVRQYNSRLVDSEGCIALCTIIILVGVTNMRKGKDPPPSLLGSKKAGPLWRRAMLVSKESGEKVILCCVSMRMLDTLCPHCGEPSTISHYEAGTHLALLRRG